MKKTSSSQTSKGKKAVHKLGKNRNEIAKRARQVDNNFKQSRDVREDRGTRQTKSSAKNPPTRGGQ
jgi:hypothetical protein